MLVISHSLINIIVKCKKHENYPKTVTNREKYNYQKDSYFPQHENNYQRDVYMQGNNLNHPSYDRINKPRSDRYYGRNEGGERLDIVAFIFSRSADYTSPVTRSIGEYSEKKTESPVSYKQRAGPFR